MKKLTAVLLLVLFVASLAACSGKQNADYDPEGYRQMFDAAIRLPREFSRELLDLVLPPSETDYYIELYNGRDRNYMVELKNEFDSMSKEYSEKYGDDYVIKYDVVEAEVKDEAGIAQYKNYDSHYFNTYGVDTDKIQAVTFVTVRLTISGSKDEYSREKTLQCFCIDGVWYSFYGAMLTTKL